MGAPRRLAERILRAVLRFAPEQCREWAEAMLCELEFVDGEWSALWWALGGLAAIFRHAVRVGWTRLKNGKQKEEGMKSTGRKALGVVVGMVSALALVGSGLAALRILGILFPGLEHSGWAYWIAVMAIPEAVFVAATVLLWRKRGPVAAGILAMGLVMALHVAVHLSLHHR